MKYTLLQSVRNLVFAGLLLPGTIAPIDTQKLTQLANFGVNSGENKTEQVQEVSEPDYALTVNFNQVNPVTIEEPQVKIMRGLSRFDEKRRAEFSQHLEKVTEPSFELKRALVQKIAEEKGIDPKILEAVWQVESGKRWNSAVRSYAGATGPAQFMAGTFRRYGEDYDKDGKANITSAHDSLAAAANLLIANGLKDGDIHRALLAYNHADWYVKKVLKVAESITY